MLICFDKNGSINLFDVELRRLEIGIGCNRFLMYRGSPDSKDLWANKHTFSKKKTICIEECPNY